MAEALQVAGSALAETEKASLREAQAKQRSAQEDELARDMAEMSYQMQDSSQGKESNELLIHTKARIKQIQLAIGEAMTREQTRCGPQNKASFPRAPQESNEGT